MPNDDRAVVSTSPSPGALPGASTLSYDSALILNAIPGGVYSLDLEGRATLVNDAAARMLGWSSSELVGRLLHDVIHHTRPDGLPYPHRDCPAHQTLDDGQVRHVATDIMWRRDGTSVPVEIESRPILRNGTVVGALVVFHDITERQRAGERAKQLLREQVARARVEFQHAQLREVLAQIPALICVTRGPRHVIDTTNELFQRAIGGRMVAGMPIAEALPDLPAERLAVFDAAYSSGRPFTGTEVVNVVQTERGPEDRYFNFVVQPLRDESGLVYGLLTHAVDVSGQVRARHELEQRTTELEKTSERLRLAADAGRLGAWEWDVKRGHVVWSPELERIHGLEPGSFPGTFDAYQKDIHPDDLERVMRTIQETVAERKPLVLEYRIVPPDGPERWLEARGRMFLDAEDQPERLVGICMDVTDRKNSEQALRTQHRLTELLAEVGLILTRSESLRGMLQACAEAMVSHADAAFARIWTLDETEQILHLQASAGMHTHLDGPHGRVPVGKLKIGLIAQEREPHLTNDLAGDSRIADQEWVRREGLVSFAGYPLMVGSHLVGVLATFSRHRLREADMPALGAVAHSIAIGIRRTQQEEALRLSERDLRARADELARLARALERSNRELDTFAYAASHDLRAPLRGISNLAQWIEEDLQGEALIKDDTREMLHLMRSRMYRMEALIEGLLQYSRAGRVHQEPELVDTRRLVRDAADLISPPDGTAIVIADDLPSLRAEKLPLQQVFMNLVSNAVKHAGRDDLQVRISARDAGEFYEFAVQDNGPGVAAEYHDRIWNIFQTLEARDKVEGTGIGLALVKKIVEAQGGRAWVESKDGEGATFKFLCRKLA